MPAPLPAPRVPLDFPPLAIAGDQTARLSGHTPLRTEADDQTVSPGGQTACGTEAADQIVSPGNPIAHETGTSSPTATPGGPTSRPYVAPPSPASPSSTATSAAPMTSVVPHVAPLTPHSPRSAPTSTTPIAPSAAPASQPYPLHYSCRPWAAREPPTLHLYQQSPPAKVVPVVPPINPHPMTTQMKQGF
jgi:hypothetical protein